VPWIVKKIKDDKVLYYRNLRHASHFTENRNEAEKFNSVGMAEWAAKTIDGEIEEVNRWGKKKN